MYMYLRHNNKGIVTSWLHGLNGENNNCDNTYGTALHVYVSVTYVLCPGISLVVVLTLLVGFSQKFCFTSVEMYVMVVVLCIVCQLLCCVAVNISQSTSPSHQP